MAAHDDDKIHETLQGFYRRTWGHDTPSTSTTTGALLTSGGMGTYQEVTMNGDKHKLAVCIQESLDMDTIVCLGKARDWQRPSLVCVENRLEKENLIKELARVPLLPPSSKPPASRYRERLEKLKDKRRGAQ